MNRLKTFIQTLHRRVLLTDVIVLVPLVYHALLYFTVGAAPESVLPSWLAGGNYIIFELSMFLLFNIGLYLDSRYVRLFVSTCLILITSYVCFRYIGTRGMSYAYNLAYLIGHEVACIINYYNVHEMYRRKQNGTYLDEKGKPKWLIF